MFATSRQELREKWWGAKVTPTDRVLGLWPAEVIVPADSDHWAGSLLDGISFFAETVAELPHDRRHDFVTPILRKLWATIGSVPRGIMTGTNFMPELSDMLNLPIWRRRHELYSAWVATRITGALHDLGPGINAPEGILEFAFKGTRLATFESTRAPLHLWAELRTPLVAPRGHGRKRSIQPDYSLTRDTANAADSVVVVECKQYWKESTKNFSDALNDYAMGRPNAHVVLVNYGTVRATLAEKVDNVLRPRTSFISEFRPKRPSALAYFQDILRRKIVSEFALPPRQPAPAGQIGVSNHSIEGLPFVDASAAEATLTWGAEPLDLDLYLWIGREAKVCYSRPGTLSAAPWAALDVDVRDGWGPEVIRVARWVELTYVLAVNAFSNERPLRESMAVVTLTLGQRSFRFLCPTEGEGDWWLVCLYDPATGLLNTVNRIGIAADLGLSI